MKTPEALESISLPYLVPPPHFCLLSAPSPSPSPATLHPSHRCPGPREALPGEVPRGLICCHLISICCTWELSLDRDLGKQEAAAEAVRWRSSGEGPILCLPSLARPLQASVLTVQGPLASSWGGEMRINETLCIGGLMSGGSNSGPGPPVLSLLGLNLRTSWAGGRWPHGASLGKHAQPLPGRWGVHGPVFGGSSGP